VAARQGLSLGSCLTCSCLLALEATQSAFAQADLGPAPAPLSILVSEQVSRDDNLYRVPSGLDLGTIVGPNVSRADVISHTAISTVGNWALGNQSAAIAAELDGNRFAHNSGLDNISGRGSLDWLWQLGHALSGRVGADYSRTLQSFVNTRFLGRDLFTTTGYSGDARVDVAPEWSVRAQVRHADTAHENPARNVDDFSSNAGTVSITYENPLGDTVAASYRRTEARFPYLVLVDGLPFDRDYGENAATFDTTYVLSAKTTVKASAGFLRREYLHSLTGNFSGGIWNASIDWSALRTLRLTAASWRDLRAYIDSQSDHFVSRAESITSQWLPNSALTVALAFSFERQTYLGQQSSEILAPQREDRVKAGEATITYTSVRNFFASLAYRVERRASTTAYFSYVDNLAQARVGMRF